MTERIFEGLRVLDLSTVLAGPSVATFFAELGATVIKIENPRNGGDVTRSWKLPTENAEGQVSSYFSSVNYKKNYQWMDISSLDNRSALEELIRTSDVLITNFKKGDDIKFRLTPEEVKQIHPSIIYGRISGYGQQSDRVAYDVVLQAESGYMSMNGTTDSGPVKMPVAMIDVIAAHQLKEGILCAIIQRQKTGRGYLIDCSLEKAGLSALVNQASNYLMNDHVAKRMGSLHPNIAPYGEIFYARDNKPLVLAVGSDKQFGNLVRILGAPALATDERFLHNQSRLQHRDDMFQVLSSLFKTKDRDEWIEVFIHENVPAGAIKTMDEVMNTSVAKEMILAEEIERVVTKRIRSAAFELNEI